MSVQDIDRGYKKLFEMAEKMSRKPYVKVGVVGNAAKERDDDGATVAEYASYNEFGTENIPERSFIRATIDERRNRLFGKALQLQSAVLAGKMSLDLALDQIGLLTQANIQQKIEKLRDPANAPSTVAAKGSSNPLIDTGRLRQSISYEKVKGGDDLGGAI